MEKIKNSNDIISTTDVLNVLDHYISKYENKIAFASSLSIEDQVITDLILSLANSKSVKIFTIDTGRLPSETYDLIDKTNKFFDIKLDVYSPNSKNVEEMVKSKGINLFYDSVESRRECCNLRKIEPLKRALSGMEAWICGLRTEQSVTRTDLEIVEIDKLNNLVKINPLLNWTEDMVFDYINGKSIPYSSLYELNYKSIGCSPCTRPVNEGEDIRSGRWWWENPETKECGLHHRKIKKVG